MSACFRASPALFRDRTLAVVARGAVARDRFFEAAPVRIRGRAFGGSLDGGIVADSVKRTDEELQKLKPHVRKWLFERLPALVRQAAAAAGVPEPSPPALSPSALQACITTFFNRLAVNTADGDSFMLDECLPAEGQAAARSVSSLRTLSDHFLKVTRRVCLIRYFTLHVVLTLALS
jgi:hypothetical protein